jgi:hypothetical protein
MVAVTDISQKGKITVVRKEEALSTVICTTHEISLQYKRYALNNIYMP